MALSMIEHSEIRYWYSVVRTYMNKRANWAHIDEATIYLLMNTGNQEYITDEIEYPVMRWRQLYAQLPEGRQI